MKNRNCPTTAVFPKIIAILTRRRTRICDFIIFPRNKSKKIIGLPKFACQFDEEEVETTQSIAV